MKYVIALALMLFAVPALATDMETVVCRNGIVSKGNVQAEVVAKCGEPAQKSQWEEKRFSSVRESQTARSTASIVTINDWTYNFGPNQFMQRLLFESGRLVRIESLGYGY